MSFMPERSMPERFHQLHDSGTFVLPNPWDVGSAKILESLGFEALATTSSGHAASHGRHDQNITLDEVLAHSEALVAAIGIPLNIDSERCFAETTEGVNANVRRMAETGAAGCSIEDYNPATGTMDPVTMAAERVAAAVEAANNAGMVLTARAENHIRGVSDLDDTLTRLTAYVAAGAHVVYAPGLIDLIDIARVVSETGKPVNVLAFPTGPTVDELAAAGVRRVSTGSLLAKAALGSLMAAATELRDAGTFGFAQKGIRQSDLETAFGPAD